MARTSIRRLLGGVLVFTAVVVASFAGAAAFLLTAAASTAIPVLATAGLVVMAGTAFLIGRPAFTLLGARGPRRAATLTALGATAALAVLASVTVLRPGPIPQAAPAPAGVRYWELPTGSRIAYVHAPATGTPRPTPVIFLHGGPGTPGEGIPVGGEALAAAGFDVYSYDQVGAGRSTRLPDVTGYTVARHVADLEAIRRTIGADRLVIVGQSWGGSLAAQYVAAHPDRVAKVVFTAPGALWPGSRPDSDFSRRLTPEEQRRYDELAGSPRMLTMSILLGINPNAAHALMGDREADARFHELALVGRNTGSCPGAPVREPHGNRQGFYVNQITSEDFLRVPDPRPKLRHVRVPVLIMRGSCDFIPVEGADEYRRTFPDATLVPVANAGHSIAGDQPDAYTRLLRTFLTER
ncbi:alpha/beta fold hydrolase [Nonomuraea angiospora]|uniref:Proline iminopeptidase n=1 Tax=Nonomuraea angiospora TaxID=46172 RepID=A0ABR9M067_9ACTN|nr:alpha/beta hydrolase [Nonomuraea angiospora]MBE1586289.1 proline iminopeptidase [Nonomuraea angiospora]